MLYATCPYMYIKDKPHIYSGWVYRYITRLTITIVVRYRCIMTSRLGLVVLCIVLCHSMCRQSYRKTTQFNCQYWSHYNETACLFETCTIVLDWFSQICIYAGDMCRLLRTMCNSGIEYWSLFCHNVLPRVYENWWSPEITFSKCVCVQYHFWVILAHPTVIGKL